MGDESGDIRRLGNQVAHGFRKHEGQVMPNRTGRMMGLVAIALPMFAGCASNVAQVRTRGALDLSCDVSNVNVQLTERPYVGVTRYEATGCGASRSYECSSHFYTLGVPLGERTCKRAGGDPTVAIAPTSVAF